MDPALDGTPSHSAVRDPKRYSRQLQYRLQIRPPSPPGELDTKGPASFAGPVVRLLLGIGPTVLRIADLPGFSARRGR